MSGGQLISKKRMIGDLRKLVAPRPRVEEMASLFHKSHLVESGRCVGRRHNQSADPGQRQYLAAKGWIFGPLPVGRPHARTLPDSILHSRPCQSVGPCRMDGDGRAGYYGPGRQTAGKTPGGIRKAAPGAGYRKANGGVCRPPERSGVIRRRALIIMTSYPVGSLDAV